MIRLRRLTSPARMCGAGALIALFRLLWGCADGPLVGLGKSPVGSVAVCVEQVALADAGPAQSSDGGDAGAPAAGPQCALPGFTGLADGTSIIPILVTTDPPGGDAGAGGASPIDLHLFVSNGTWLSPEGTMTPDGGSSLDVQVIDGTPYSAAFVAGTSPSPAWVHVSRGDADDAIFVPLTTPAFAGAVSVCVEQIDSNEAGPDSATCNLSFPGAVADGRTIVPVLVKTTPPAFDGGTPDQGAGPALVTLSLYVSHGSWRTPEGLPSSSLNVQVIDGTPFPAAFVTGTSTAPTLVSVSRGDMTQTMQVSMLPATLTGLSLKAGSNVLSAKTTGQVQITAQVLAANAGRPSDGTIVQFSTTSSDPGVEIFPQTSPVDSTGTAVATLFFVPCPPGSGCFDGGAPYAGPASITVNATALPPGAGGVPVEAGMQSGSVSIAVSP